ncbi:MAG TPA: class I SAM-dependent methyltransferase [Flavisolibacter sp.]|nr:class I SAM-dependent methyltransferase [Flavisolibacter sp.]
MSATVHYTECPVCSNSRINPLLTVADNSVSKESFVIWQCAHCTLRFTQDAPDENSIERYYKSENYISHTNTDEGFINQLYKRVRKYTLEQKAALINATTGIKEGTLLDVGCGIGAFLHTMGAKGWNVKGLEPDSNARKLAKKLYDIDAEEPAQLFQLSPGSFNAITLWHVLEHVHELHGYMKQLKNLLASNGRLFIAVPNYTSLDADMYGVNWAAYDVPRHLYHFTPTAMTALVEQHGMKVISKKPMWFDSFYVSMLSSKYRSGHTSYISSIINGLRSNLKALQHTDNCSSLIYIISKA